MTTSEILHFNLTLWQNRKKNLQCTKGRWIPDKKISSNEPTKWHTSISNLNETAQHDINMVSSWFQKNYDPKYFRTHKRAQYEIATRIFHEDWKKLWVETIWI